MSSSSPPPTSPQSNPASSSSEVIIQNPDTNTACAIKNDVESKMVSSNRMDDEKGHQKSSMVAPSSSSDFNRNEQSSVIKKSIDSSSSPTQSLQKFSLMSLSPSAKAISSASDKESGPLSLSVEKIYPEKTEDHSASIAKNDSDSSNTIAILTNVSSNPFPSSDNSSQEYHLKWVKWQGSQSKLPIVTQNSNGSCPLLAIINVLLLRKNITFPPIIEMVTASQLMDYLCDCILNYVPKNLPEQIKLNYEQNLQDAMSIMPRLQTGLDVNVKFTGIMDFEYTPECIIFDLLRIPLYHGWLVDSDQREICRIISNQSYNQLVDKIIASKTSNSDKSEMFLAEEFLNQTASQLTNYGLSQLIKHIKDEEPCILFRNNHFITLYKHKGKLFQLVTDQGFLTESNVVWESLDNIEGDTYFVDGDFVLVPPKPSSSLHSSTIANTQQQIDQDYLIALSLEQEQNFEAERLKSLSNSNESSSPMTDEELARKLQSEENQYYEQMQKKETIKINTVKHQSEMNQTSETKHDSDQENCPKSVTKSSQTHCKKTLQSRSSSMKASKNQSSNFSRQNFTANRSEPSNTSHCLQSSGSTVTQSESRPNSSEQTDRQSVSSKKSSKNCIIS